jgi:hypothetical protein
MKLKNRFDTFTARKKLAILFVIYWLYWFVATWLFDLAWDPAEPKKMVERIFHATWMAVFWPLFFNWKLVKETFKSRKHD